VRVTNLVHMARSLKFRSVLNLPSLFTLRRGTLHIYIYIYIYTLMVRGGAIG